MAAITLCITHSGGLMVMAPGTTRTQEFTAQPEEYMDHTAGLALVLATTRAPALMPAAPLRMDHTEPAEPRKLTTRGRGPMPPRARARMFMAVGDRRTSSAAMIG